VGSIFSMETRLAKKEKGVPAGLHLDKKRQLKKGPGDYCATRTPEIGSRPPREGRGGPLVDEGRRKTKSHFIVKKAPKKKK